MKYIHYFWKQVKEGLTDIFIVWRDEFSLVIHDAAILMLFIVAPLLYPIVYSLIYSHADGLLIKILKLAGNSRIDLNQ